MVWIFIVVGVVAAGIGAWLGAPSLRSLFRRDFEPSSKDELSIYRAQSSGDSRGAGQ